MARAVEQDGPHKDWGDENSVSNDCQLGVPRRVRGAN